MLSDVQALVDDLVRDNLGQVTPDQRDTAIELALARYSVDRPREATELFVSPGGLRLVMPLTWGPECRIVGIEWPIDQVPPARVTFYPVRSTTGRLEALVETEIPGGDDLLIHYLGGHVLTEAEDTTAAADREAIAAYASSVLFEQLASLAARNTDSTISADSVDHRSQAQEYSARARAARKRYFDALGLGEATVVKPGGASVAWPSQRRFPGAGALPYRGGR